VGHSTRIGGWGATMECYACRRKVPLAHHVKFRGDVTQPWGPGPPPGGPDGMT
jgi:hypothetical protein